MYGKETVCMSTVRRRERENKCTSGAKGLLLSSLGSISMSEEELGTPSLQQTLGRGFSTWEIALAERSEVKNIYKIVFGSFSKNIKIRVHNCT